MIIINPGTEANYSATLANAETIALMICEDVGLPNGSYVRNESRDNDGWFGFDFTRNGRVFEVDIPGDDPATVTGGRPFAARRLYVNGSSWLYGYAINRFFDDED